MNEYGPWTQANWYALGSFLIQVGLLVAGVWFARNIVKTMRAFQEQIGALLRLSITSIPAERQSSGADASPYWLTPSVTHAVTAAEPTESGPGRPAVIWHNLILWLQEPTSPAELIHLRQLITWLQAPAGSCSNR